MRDTGFQFGTGLYLPVDLPAAHASMSEYERFLDSRFQIVSFYEAWGSPAVIPNMKEMNLLIGAGRVPMITWEPWTPRGWREGGQPEEQPEFSLSRILNGVFDAYMRIWAAELKKISAPIFFRPMHEMNGNWYPWCGKVNGNRPAEYVEVWRYIRSIFREEECDRLKWIWSPYAHSVPDEPDNDMSHYFPGPEEVDWVGIDGYNWGSTREWSRWQGFEEIFSEAYDRLTQLAPGKPIMIAETASAEEGGDKGAWIRGAFMALRERFPRIEGLVWFNMDKECDWRIESSKLSAASFRQCWKDFSRSA